MRRLAGEPACEFRGVRQSAGIDQRAVDGDARRRHDSGERDRLRVGDLLDLDRDAEPGRGGLHHLGGGFAALAPRSIDLDVFHCASP